MQSYENCENYEIYENREVYDTFARPLSKATKFIQRVAGKPCRKVTRIAKLTKFTKTAKFTQWMKERTMHIHGSINGIYIQLLR